MLGTEVVDTTTQASSNLLLRSSLNINRNESQYWRIVTWKWNWNFLMGNCLYSFSLVFRSCHSEVEKTLLKSRQQIWLPWTTSTCRKTYLWCVSSVVFVGWWISWYRLGRNFLPVHLGWFLKHLTCAQKLRHGTPYQLGWSYHSIMESLQKSFPAKIRCNP